MIENQYTWIQYEHTIVMTHKWTKRWPGLGSMGLDTIGQCNCRYLIILRVVVDGDYPFVDDKAYQAKPCVMEA